MDLNLCPTWPPPPPSSRAAGPPLTKTYARKPKTKDTAKPQDTLKPANSTNTNTVLAKDTSVTDSTTSVVVAPSSHVPTNSEVMATTNTAAGPGDTTNTMATTTIS